MAAQDHHPGSPGEAEIEGVSGAKVLPGYSALVTLAKPGTVWCHQEQSMEGWNSSKWKPFISHRWGEHCDGALWVRQNNFMLKSKNSGAWMLQFEPYCATYCLGDLGHLIYFSKPQYSYLKSRDTNSNYTVGLSWRWNGLLCSRTSWHTRRAHLLLAFILTAGSLYQGLFCQHVAISKH